jgi:hypothetical protein
MPRLPELTLETAPPATRKLMEAQQAMFGMVLNPLKLLGYCPTIVEGQAALRGVSIMPGTSKRACAIWFTRWSRA